MSYEEAAIKVLRQYNRPLHYKELAEIMLNTGLAKPRQDSKTPWNTIFRDITEEIRHKKEAARFINKRGIISLKEWQNGGQRSTPENPNHDDDQIILVEDAPCPLATSQEAEMPGKSISIPTFDEIIKSEEKNVRATISNILDEMPPDKFEHLCARILKAFGFSNIEVTQRSRDGGVDGLGQMRIGAVQIRVAFQSKRWSSQVGRPEIDRFRGAISGQFDQGLFMTTSNFSDEARNASVRPGAVTIVLLDRESIIDTMLEHGIGVRRIPLYSLSVDSEFFDFDNNPHLNEQY
jgi:hypothetical protein